MSIFVENVFFPSKDVDLKGRMYRPARDGRYPAVAICQGYPGDIKNMDLAEELALNDIVALIFYYRGAWGSGGTYSFVALDQSAEDAVAYLRRLPFVDPERVGLVSHSMGTLPLTKRLSMDHSLKAGVLMAPVTDISVWTMSDALDTVVPRFVEQAKGKLDGLTQDQLRVDLKEVTVSGNPIILVEGIETPLMVIVGSEDDITPPELCHALYERAKDPKKWVIVEGADHGFTEHRIPLMRIVIDWLKSVI